MATLFALSDGDISTIGSLNSAAAIGNPGVLGSVLSASRATATATSYTINTPVYGIALCLSSVGTIAPGDTIRIRLSTTDYTYNAQGLTPGVYSNSYVLTQPQAMVGWILFKLPAPVTYSAAPALSVFGPNAVRLLGSGAGTPGSILVYGPYNNISQPTDIIYLTKSLTTGFVSENRNVSGSLSSANVYICDGVTSSNNFNISQATGNNIYIGRGGIFTGTSVATGANMSNQFIHVLDGATLSASYPVPTITTRIKAVSSAIVDLNNVVGFSMKSSGVYNNTNALTPAPYDYLHDITTGYAKFNNTVFWSGISAHNLVNAVANLSVVNSTFNEKYFYGATPTEVKNNYTFIIGNKTLNNVLLTGVNITENLVLSGLYNNFQINSANITKKFDIIGSRFTGSIISNTTLASNSALDGIVMSGNSALPALQNIVILNRKTGITKNDSCALDLDGLSCLSSYYYSFSARDLTGELNNVLCKDSTYGACDIKFNSFSLPLTINGLTASRASNDVLTSSTLTAGSVLSAYSPFVGSNSVLLSSISANIVSPIPKLLTYNDDLTIEAWYSPISARLVGINQSLITIWDPLSTTSSTLGCVVGLYINPTGQIILQKGLSANGTPSIIATVPPAYPLTNNRWYHIATTKSGNNYTIYLDGKFVVSAVTPGVAEREFFRTSNTGSYNVYLGARPYNRTTFGDSLCGYVGGAKISYGLVYKDEFAVPTTPFSTTDGTLFNYAPGSSATYSTMPRVFIDIQSNSSYQPVSLNGLKFIANNSLSSSLIDISNSSYEKFEVNNSDLRTKATPLIMDNNQDYIRGSYVFNRCQIDSSIVDANNIAGYQPYTYREAGFAVQYANEDPNNHYKWTRGGKVSLDSSSTYQDLPTEKLESISDVYPLKSSVKLIPVSQGSLIKGISLTYKTPVSYVSGGYLKVDKNTILGINEDTILGSLPGTNDTWTTITLSLSDFNNPFWKQKAYLESYVELIGSNKQLQIAKWQVSTI